jgi:isoleucyl-tRNA synthetase
MIIWSQYDEFLRHLRDKWLIYKGKRVSLYSTKLETPISNFEVAMDDTYEEVNDPAITVMFDLSEWMAKNILAWTTTPWTIPLNIALAVNKDVMYVYRRMWRWRLYRRSQSCRDILLV